MAEEITMMQPTEYLLLAERLKAQTDAYRECTDLTSRFMVLLEQNSGLLKSMGAEDRENFKVITERMHSVVSDMLLHRESTQNHHADIKEELSDLSRRLTAFLESVAQRQGSGVVEMVETRDLIRDVQGAIGRAASESVLTMNLLREDVSGQTKSIGALTTAITQMIEAAHNTRLTWQEKVRRAAWMGGGIALILWLLERASTFKIIAWQFFPKP